MKLLNCTVRLGGELLHSVPKERVSEREIMLLKHIHGNDAIVDLKHVGDIEVPLQSEYRRLARYYGLTNVQECFDVKLDNFQEWLEEQLQNEEAAREERKLYAETVTVDHVQDQAPAPAPAAGGMSDEEFEAEIQRRALQLAEAKIAEVLEMQAEQAEQARLLALQKADAPAEAPAEQPEEVEQAVETVKAETPAEPKPAAKKAVKAETAINLE